MPLPAVNHLGCYCSLYVILQLAPFVLLMDNIHWIVCVEPQRGVMDAGMKHCAPVVVMRGFFSIAGTMCAAVVCGDCQQGPSVAVAALVLCCDTHLVSVQSQE